jgi:hypothetical protein
VLSTPSGGRSVDHVGLGRDIREALQLERQLLRLDPTPPSGQAAIGAELLDGVIVHGGASWERRRVN